MVALDFPSELNRRANSKWDFIQNIHILYIRNSSDVGNDASRVMVFCSSRSGAHVLGMRGPQEARRRAKRLSPHLYAPRSLES